MPDLVYNGAWLDARGTMKRLADGSLRPVEARPALRAHFDALKTAPAGTTGKALKAWKIRRGFELETVILVLAAIDRLDPTLPYRPKGEQIDGSFVVGQRRLLLEARWREGETNAADVFAFQGKLRGKLVGTLGLVVSVAGFSDDAPAAIVYGKEIDVILADLRDVELALAEVSGLKKVVTVKLREAARTGNVYYGYQEWLDIQDA